MLNTKSGARRPLSVLMAGMIIWSLCLVDSASAQRRFKPDNRVTSIQPGTTISVRTNEEIEVKDTDADVNQVFTGSVDQDVVDRNGAVAIPRGSDVEMVVRKVSNNELALDLNSITVGNQRYGLQTDTTTTNSTRKEGLGKNKRTGKYVGGGAVLGAIIGGIAGGGKGAIIGAGAGAAAGAGAQVLTRGKDVSVPAESLLTFRLAQPMQLMSRNSGITQSGIRNRTNDSGYSNATGNIRIGDDHNISWQSSVPATIYVQVDNQPRKLFAQGDSGRQDASWITSGHRYVFVMVDQDGYEIARDVMDLR